MENQTENLEFGDFGDLAPEEFAKVSQILHGDRKVKESKVEFPWDSSLETGLTFTTQYGETMETSDVVGGHFSMPENVYFGQGDQYVNSINEGQSITFVGTAEPPYQNLQSEQNQGVTYGFTNERSNQSHQAQHDQNVQQGFYTQNPAREQVNQQMDYSRNYGGNQFRPSNDGHVTVSVNDGSYQYNYSKQMADNNQMMSDEMKQAQLANMDLDNQPSQRPYERRNKKKRPPEYYKQMEAEIEAERQRQFSVNPNSPNMDWNRQYVQNSQVDSYSNSVPSLPPSDNFRNQNYDSQQQQYMNYGTPNYSSQIPTQPPGTLVDKNSLHRDNRFPNSLGQQGPIVHNVNKPTYDRPVSNVDVYRKPVSNFGGQSDQVDDLHMWQKHSNSEQNKSYVYSNVHEDPAVLSAGSSTHQQMGAQEAAPVSNYRPNNCDKIERNSNQIYDNRTNNVNVVSQELSDLSLQKNSAIENANTHHHHHASVPISHEKTKPVTITANDQLLTDQNLEFPAIVPSNRPLNDGQKTFDNKTAETKEMTADIVSNSCDVPPGGAVDNNKVNVSLTDKENISMDSQMEIENTNIQSTQPVEAPKPKVGSWAGLFRDTETAKSAVTIPYYGYQGTSASSNSPGSGQKEEEKKSKDVEKTPCEVTKDSAANMLGEQLASMKISHVQNALQPRGLINRGNWCYINATLQALLACPPFVNLMKKLATFHFEERGSTSTPVLDSLIEFVNEFSGFIRAPKGPQRGGNKKSQEIITGSSFEPIRVYKMLEVVKDNSSFKHGKQEDAEEFLSCILDGIHEEMSATINLNSGANNTATKSNGYLQEDTSSIADEEEVTDESWEQVGPKKKSVQTRRADFARSPIAEIFTGYIRSAVFKKTAKESATLQPFFTLQLDIQSEKVLSVKDALEGLVSKESVGGFTCSQTNEELEILRKITLEELPPVLILHLKFFVYDKDGGCQKLMKQIDYDIDLEITRDLLSPNVKTKLNHHQRSYKLFAVVYHHGEKSTGGHYTTAVFHSGIMGWINIDDSNIKMVHVNNVLRYTKPRIPYLLYYRRLDV